jgi:hypothetical protein
MSSYVLVLFDTQVCPTRPFTIDCLWPVVFMDLYRNRGQVQHCMDIFRASLVQTFSPMVGFFAFVGRIYSRRRYHASMSVRHGRASHLGSLTNIVSDSSAIAPCLSPNRHCSQKCVVFRRIESLTCLSCYSATLDVTSGSRYHEAETRRS